MQTISVDLIPGGLPPIIRISQYDKILRAFSIHLTTGGSDYPVPDGYTVTLSGTKPDGKGFLDSLQPSGSTLDISVTEQMSAAAGDVPCEITLYKPDGGRIASGNFLLRVEKAALDAGTVVSDSDIPFFEHLVEQSSASAAGAKTAEGKAESAASDAEQSRTSASASASTAKTSEINAAASAGAAKASASGASSSAADAKSSASGASSSAEAAKSSASSASAAAGTASSKASAAASSASAAKESETNAASSAEQAKASADSISESKSQIAQNTSDIAAVQKTVNGFGTAAGYDVIAAGLTDSWGKIPVIGKADGVIELGKYIDFHTTAGNQNDYDLRINAATDGFSLTKKSGERGTIDANLAVTKLTPAMKNCSAGAYNCYYRVGRMVVCCINVQITSALAASTVLVQGLPGAIADSAGCICISNGVGVRIDARPNGTIIVDGAVSNAGWYNGCLVYITAS
jgi:hypothetical protein